MVEPSEGKVPKISLEPVPRFQQETFPSLVELNNIEKRMTFLNFKILGQRLTTLSLRNTLTLRRRKLGEL